MSSSEGSSSIPVSGLDMGRGSPRRGSSEEPRLAFIGCETTSTLSSPLSLSGGHHGGKCFANVLGFFLPIFQKWKWYFVLKIVLIYCEKKITQTVKQKTFLSCYWRFLQIETIGTNDWDEEIYKNKLWLLYIIFKVQVFWEFHKNSTLYLTLLS